MSAQEMIAELPRLSDEERELVATALRVLASTGETQDALEATKPRRAGMHAGAWIVADDFDEPLPDSFWLGEDA